MSSVKLLRRLLMISDSSDAVFVNDVKIMISRSILEM